MVAVQRAVSAKDPDMKNIDELKSTGLKATLPRLKILEIFQTGAQRHMTAEDVFRVLLDERSDIGLATVYRVLTQFERSEEHTSELQSPCNLVCRLLLEKKKITYRRAMVFQRECPPRFTH